MMIRKNDFSYSREEKRKKNEEEKLVKGMQLMGKARKNISSTFLHIDL